MQKYGDNYATLTLNQDDTSTYKFMSVSYNQWEMPHCIQSTDFSFYYYENDTLVDGTNTLIPRFSNSSKNIMAYFPVDRVNARFNTSIYWSFAVTSPQGTETYRSNPWHVTYCHN